MLLEDEAMGEEGGKGQRLDPSECDSVLSVGPRE